MLTGIKSWSEEFFLNEKKHAQAIAQTQIALVAPCRAKMFCWCNRKFRVSKSPRRSMPSVYWAYQQHQVVGKKIKHKMLTSSSELHWVLSVEPAINIKRIEKESKMHTHKHRSPAFCIYYAKINYYVREPHEISCTTIDMLHVWANVQFNSIQFNSHSIIYVCVCGLTCCIHLEIAPEIPYQWN